MNILKRIDPRETPPSISASGSELLILRDSVLQTYLNLAVVLLFLATLGLLLTGAPQTQPLWVIISAVLSLFTVVAAIMRRWKYETRATLVALLFYLGGMLGLYLTGSEIGSLLMVGYLIIVGVLLGRSASIQSSILVMLTMVTFGYAAQQQYLNIPGVVAGQTDTVTLWFLKSLVVLAIAWVALAAIHMILNKTRQMSDNQSIIADEITRERQSLTARVESRTKDLNRRMNQVHTAVDVIHAIGDLRDPQTMLQTVADLIAERFGLYYVGIFLPDDHNEYAVLRAGTGDAGTAMLAAHHRLAIGGASMIGWAISQKTARIALDTGQEAVRFNNPHLPLTRSELALPIMHGQEVLGALSVQSTDSSAFDEEDIRVFMGIAASLGVALENARLFDEFQNSLEEIHALNRNYLTSAWSEVERLSGELNYVYTNPAAPARTGRERLIQLPLTLRDQVIGEVTIETSQAALSPEELELADAIATQTAIALENARLIEETQRRALTEQKLSQISAQFTQSVNIDEILQIAVKELGQLPAVNEVTVQLIMPDEKEPPRPNGFHPEVMPA